MLTSWNMSSRLRAGVSANAGLAFERREPASGEEEPRGAGRRRREDLSLPADVESAPWAPSRQPGRFTSCRRDWLSMDPRPWVAANSELIKEHFSAETLSRNQAHPTPPPPPPLREHAAFNPFTEREKLQLHQNRCHRIARWEIASRPRRWTRTENVQRVVKSR